MRLAVVFPMHNQFALTEAVLDVAKANLSGDCDVSFFVIDNGSAVPFVPSLAPIEKGKFELHGIRLNKNIGVYPIFWEALKHVDESYDIVAYLHSDVFVAEKGWDYRVIRLFEERERLGLVGFIGSNEIDAAGGRGLGTASNFMGQEYSSHLYRFRRDWSDRKAGEILDRATLGDGAIFKDLLEEGVIENVKWTGSAAEVHGRRETGYMNAAVVDGCVMIFRRSVLASIPERSDFPPHHFYDRLLSCEVREKGYEVAVLGVGFDHISGQTVNQEPTYHDMAKEWCDAHGVPPHEGGWDIAVYEEAEKQWLGEYRDIKHLVPCFV